MIIKFKNDENISESEMHHDQLAFLISEEIKRYKSQIKVMEVYLADEKSKREGSDFIRCLVEVRFEDRQPMAVSNKADNIELALYGAINKLKYSLNMINADISNE